MLMIPMQSTDDLITDGLRILARIIADAYLADDRHKVKVVRRQRRKSESVSRTVRNRVNGKSRK